MQNYSIGLSGLNAAQTALDVIGNNVANAATDGYHRQRIELAPSSLTQGGGVTLAGGVDVVGVTRLLDGMLEREILRQQSANGQVAQELSILGSLETTFGEFGEQGGLNAALDSFFDTLRSLAAHPLENVWRNEVLSSAKVLTSEFRRLGTALTDLEDQIVLEAQNTGDSVNVLVQAIAELNSRIQTIEINHGEANNLRDHRDHLISELSELASVETQAREHGVVDVAIAGLPVVTGAVSSDIEVGLQSDQSLGVSAAGAEGSRLLVEGGRLGGLLTLKNGLLADVKSDLDLLAKSLVNQINRYHVQGLGTEGPFTELTGWAMNSTDLTDTEIPVEDGTFYVRVTDPSGDVSRHAIDVDVSGATPDTLASVAAKIDAISGLNASVVSSRLHILSDLGYKFDFMPALLPEPEASNLTAGAPPEITVSGIYKEDVNQRFTFTVVGTGSIGNGDLRMDVTNESGVTVSTLNVGAGYAAGDTIEMVNGIKIAMSPGDLNDGDSFDVQAMAATDSSGLLAAAGMNTFFSGASASEMYVCDDIVDAPDRVATAFSGELVDNAAALKLAGVREEEVDSLTGMAPDEYYHRAVANLGQEISLKQSRQDNIEAMIQNLEKRRHDMSSVNINDEAAQLMVFEKMFQAVAKYLTSLQSSMITLMELV